MKTPLEKFIEIITLKEKESEIYLMPTIDKKDINKLIKEEKHLLAQRELNLSRVTRVEVIDENGRSYVNWKPINVVELSVQDNGKTAKVFINKQIKTKKL